MPRFSSYKPNVSGIRPLPECCRRDAQIPRSGGYREPGILYHAGSLEDCGDSVKDWEVGELSPKKFSNSMKYPGGGGSGDPRSRLA